MRLTPPQQAHVRTAIDLIYQTPGHSEIARDLLLFLSRGDIRFVPTLPDRAHAGLMGALTLGPEALSGEPLGLAETLVHEHYHLRRQHPLHKTVSFWAGVLTRTNVMRAYEKPAYRAALRFLAGVEQAFPDLAGAAQRERNGIAQTFMASYGGSVE